MYNSYVSMSLNHSKQTLIYKEACTCSMSTGWKALWCQVNWWNFTVGSSDASGYGAAEKSSNNINHLDEATWRVMNKQIRQSCLYQSHAQQRTTQQSHVMTWLKRSKNTNSALQKPSLVNRVHPQLLVSAGSDLDCVPPAPTELNSGPMVLQTSLYLHPKSQSLFWMKDEDERRASWCDLCAVFISGMSPGSKVTSNLQHIKDHY